MPTPEPSPTAAEVPSRDRLLLVARGIEKSFRQGWWPRGRHLQVLRGADLELGVGEVVGLVGENGSGKSTLMKILVGALAADHGAIHRLGRIGYCPQVPQVYGRLTCDDHVELFGAAYGLSTSQARESARDLYDGGRRRAGRRGPSPGGRRHGSGAGHRRLGGRVPGRRGDVLPGFRRA